MGESHDVWPFVRDFVSAGRRVNSISPQETKGKGKGKDVFTTSDLPNAKQGTYENTFLILFAWDFEMVQALGFSGTTLPNPYSDRQPKAYASWPGTPARLCDRLVASVPAASIESRGPGPASGSRPMIWP